jgi:copper chaperone CopZ
MKSSLRIFLISFLTASSLIIFSCGEGDRPRSEDDDAHGIIVAPNHKLVKMRVPQIPCDDCKNKVETVLKNEAGIVHVKAFKAIERAQNVLVVYDPREITLDTLKKVITKLGKTVENVTEN